MFILVDHLMELEDQRSLCFTRERAFGLSATLLRYFVGRKKRKNIFWLSAFRISCSILVGHNTKLESDSGQSSSLPYKDITDILYEWSDCPIYYWIFCMICVIRIRKVRLFFYFHATVVLIWWAIRVSFGDLFSCVSSSSRCINRMISAKIFEIE